jgi:hypothetical protein
MQENPRQSATTWSKALPILIQYRLVFVVVGLFALFLGIYGLYNQKAYGLYKENEREKTAVDKITLPAWERKVETSEHVRIGLISDLRIQLENNYTFASDIEDRYTAVPDYMRPLAFFRSQMQSFQPHYIATLGNTIVGDSQDGATGAEAIQFVRRQLEKINAPTLWVLGNRDLRALTRTQFQELTDAPSAPYAIDSGDYKIIVLDTNYNSEGEPYDAASGVSEHKRGAFSAAHTQWLIEELNTSKHVVVLMHHGSFGRTVEVKKKREKSISDVETLREIFARYNVATVITGHLEAHAYEVYDGVAYYGLESIKDAGGKHPGAFYELTMSGSISDIELYYIAQDGERLISQPYEEGAQNIQTEAIR